MSKREITFMEDFIRTVTNNHTFCISTVGNKYLCSITDPRVFPPERIQFYLSENLRFVSANRTNNVVRLLRELILHVDFVKDSPILAIFKGE